MENPHIEAADLASCPSETWDKSRATMMDEPPVATDKRALRLERLDELLTEHDYPFVRIANDTWVGMMAHQGFDYVRVEVVALEQAVRFRFDSGTRAPQNAVRELNKLILLSNFEFRLTGFDVLPATGGPIVFTFLLSDEALGLDADEDAWENLRLCDEDDDEAPEMGAKLLETSFRLASKTICVFTSCFNAVIFGDVCVALDARHL